MLHREPEPVRIQLFRKGPFITATIIATNHERGDLLRLLIRTDFHIGLMEAIWELWDLALRGKTFVERQLELDVLGDSSASTTDEEHICEKTEENKEDKKEEIPDQPSASEVTVPAVVAEDEEQKG